MQPQQTPAPDTAAKTSLPCSLDSSTQALIKLIFDNDMFNDVLKDLEIGTSIMLALFTHAIYLCQSHT